MKKQILIYFLLPISIIFNIYFFYGEAKYRIQKSKYLAYVQQIKVKLKPANTVNMVESTYFDNSPITQNDIVFIGDSHTHFFKFNEFFPLKRIINRGYPGDLTLDVLARLDKIVEQKPQKIFLCVGVNDILQQSAPNEVVKNIEQIVNKIQKSTPQTKIYIQSLLPTSWYATVNYPSSYGIEECNKHLKNLCEKKQIVFVDLYPHFVNEKHELKFEYDCGDKLHLNFFGYKKWAEVVEPLLN